MLKPQVHKAINQVNAQIIAPDTSNLYDKQYFKFDHQLEAMKSNQIKITPFHLRY